jgi:hypothetical protein
MFLIGCAYNNGIQRPLGNESVSIPSTQPESKVRVVFHTEIKTQWVNDLVKYANCVINHSDFINEIESQKVFEYTEKTGYAVIAALHERRCGLRLYATKNPFSSVIATTYANDREYLYFNTRKNPRDMKYMVNTAIHECSHLAGFSHGDNSPVGKENSVPYFIGKSSESVVEKCL